MDLNLVRVSGVLACPRRRADWTTPSSRRGIWLATQEPGQNGILPAARRVCPILRGAYSTHACHSNDPWPVTPVPARASFK